MLATLAERPTPCAFPPWLDCLAEPMPDEATGWPLLAAPVSAGLPVPADDQVERRLSLDTHLIRNPETTFLMRVTGEALADAGLHNGDLLVMDRATPPLAGSVVLAIVDGTPVLTRLGRDAQGRLRVQAPGTDLSQLLDKVTMVGIARWVIHRLWPGRFSS